MTPDAVFVQDGDRFRATELALGPWYPGALHGGAPAALIVHVLNGHSVADGLRLARITYEFVRPVPVEIGLTDGVQTEVSGDIDEDTAVVVGQAQQSGADEGATPFLPQLKNDKAK